MGYQISYGPPIRALRIKKIRNLKVPLSILCVLLVLVISVSIWWNEMLEFSDVLLPGSKSAYNAFEKTLHDGGGLGEALTAFCKQVLHEADEVM